MVKRCLLAAGLVAAVTAGLCTCELFRMTAFPSYLSGVVAARDLRDYTDSLVAKYGDEWESQIRVLRDSAGSDYVFILLRVFHNNRLITLDGNLNVLAAFDDLPFGGRAMVDASDRFVIGRVVLSNPPTSTYGQLPEPSPEGLAPDYPGFSSEGMNYLVWVDGGASPDFLNYESYSAAWVYDHMNSAVIDSATRPDDWNLSLVYFDPLRAGGEVVLLLNNWSDGILEIVFTPAAAYETGPLAAEVPLTYPGFQLSGWNLKDITYTRRGIAVSYHDRSIAVYDYEGQSREALRAEIDTRSELQQSFDIDGVYFYYFDKTERYLFKGLTGWPELP